MGQKNKKKNKKKSKASKSKNTHGNKPSIDAKPNAAEADTESRQVKESSDATSVKVSEGIEGQSSEVRNLEPVDSVEPTEKSRLNLEKENANTGAEDSKPGKAASSSGEDGNTDEITNLNENERRAEKETISKLLENREKPERLSDTNILPKANVAARLQATAKGLESKLTQDTVKKKLEARPGLKDLEKIGLVKHNDSVAPALHAVGTKLETSLIRNTLKRRLSGRSDPDELISKGIIKNVSDIGTGNSNNSEEVVRSFATRRSRFAVALKAASHLQSDGWISQESKGKLKDLILIEDERVMAAVEVFEIDHDVEELLDTLNRICAVR
mmetsp:Transcript_330/g.343  ORF Transcript_330/g.343 Transcript_330/m.343 type:complete len:329 (+) Transcript_330:111-1097(+)